MLRAWVVRVVPLVLLAGLVSLLFGQQPAPAGKRYALVVGVDAYQAKNLGQLKYAGRDASALAEVLQKAGYTVVPMTSDSKDDKFKPTGKNIRRELEAMLKAAMKEDVVVVAFSGHGLQFVGDTDSFFCPSDARPVPDEKETLISMDRTYALMGKSFGSCVLLVDACRNDPGVRGVARSGVNAAASVPDGVAALFSCKAGEFAFENDERQHGVFFHYVLERLRSAVETGEEADFNDLAGHVLKCVPPEVLASHKATQTPVQKVNAGRVVLIPKTTVTLAKTFTNSNGMAMVLLPSGAFVMGSPEKEEGHSKDEGPQRTVKITRFYCGKYPVTRGQFAAFVKETGYKTDQEKRTKFEVSNTIYQYGLGWHAENKSPVEDEKYTWRNPGFVQTAEHPVVLVSWNDAQEFVKWLNSLEKRPGKYGLLREAEWEYACRAGSKTAYCFGDDPKQLKDYAWFTENSKDSGTDAVGQRKPNAWGLCDMHGNAWQWCEDWYDKNYYNKGENVDPKGLLNGNGRVLRGGSFCDGARYCRAAYRFKGDDPAFRRYDHGFRVCFRPD